MSVSLKDKWKTFCQRQESSKRTRVRVSALTPALSAVAGPAAVPVVGVEHGDVAALTLQVRVFLELLQGLVRAHVGVGELWKQRNNSITSRKMHLPLYIEHMVCRIKPTETL